MSVDKMTSMVELIGFYSGQLGPELLEDEVISFGSIIMIENEWVAQMNGRNWEDTPNNLPVILVNALAEQDRRLR